MKCSMFFFIILLYIHVKNYNENPDNIYKKHLKKEKKFFEIEQEHAAWTIWKTVDFNNFLPFLFYFNV